MGGGGGKGSTSTSSQSSSWTPEALPEIKSLYDRILQTSNIPYAPYSPQDLVAPVNANQQTGINTVMNAQSAQPYINQAASYAQQGSGPVLQDYNEAAQQLFQTPYAQLAPNQQQQVQQQSMAPIARYANPFTQQVMETTRAQMQQQNLEQEQQLRGNSTSMGGLGNSRFYAAALPQLYRQQKLAQEPTLANLAAQGYNASLQQLNADRAAAGQGANIFGNLGTTAQTAGIQQGQSQIAAGGVDQQNQQQLANAKFQEFMRAQGYPFETTKYLAGLGLPTLQAQGGSGTSTGSQTTPGGSGLSQGLGLLSMFMGADGGAVPSYEAGGRIGGVSDPPTYPTNVPVTDNPRYVPMDKQGQPGSQPSSGASSNPQQGQMKDIAKKLQAMRGKSPFGETTNPMDQQDPQSTMNSAIGEGGGLGGNDGFGGGQGWDESGFQGEQDYGQQSYGGFDEAGFGGSININGGGFDIKNFNFGGGWFNRGGEVDPDELRYPTNVTRVGTPQAASSSPFMPPLQFAQPRQDNPFQGFEGLFSKLGGGEGSGDPAPTEASYPAPDNQIAQPLGQEQQAQQQPPAPTPTPQLPPQAPPRTQLASLQPPAGVPAQSSLQGQQPQPAQGAFNKESMLGMVGQLSKLADVNADTKNNPQYQTMLKSVAQELWKTDNVNYPACAAALYSIAKGLGVNPNIKSPALAGAWNLGQRQDVPERGSIALWPRRGTIGHVSMVEDVNEKGLARHVHANSGPYNRVSRTGWMRPEGLQYYRGYNGGGTVGGKDKSQNPFDVASLLNMKDAIQHSMMNGRSQFQEGGGVNDLYLPPDYKFPAPEPEPNIFGKAYDLATGRFDIESKIPRPPPPSPVDLSAWTKRTPNIGFTDYDPNAAPSRQTGPMAQAASIVPQGQQRPTASASYQQRTPPRGWTVADEDRWFQRASAENPFASAPSGMSGGMRQAAPSAGSQDLSGHMESEQREAPQQQQYAQSPRSGGGLFGGMGSRGFGSRLATLAGMFDARTFPQAMQNIAGFHDRQDKADERNQRAALHAERLYNSATKDRYMPMTTEDGRPAAFSTATGRFINPATGQPLGPDVKVQGRTGSGGHDTAVQRLASDFVRSREERRQTNPSLPPLSREEALQMAQRASRDKQDEQAIERMALSAFDKDMTAARYKDPASRLNYWREYYGLPPKTPAGAVQPQSQGRPQPQGMATTPQSSAPLGTESNPFTTPEQVQSLTKGTMFWRRLPDGTLQKMKKD